jgi:hypothetical protein
VKFSQELAEDSPFKPWEFIAGKEGATLATATCDHASACWTS